jgi:hypothetical protein
MEAFLMEWLAMLPPLLLVAGLLGYLFPIWEYE